MRERVKAEQWPWVIAAQAKSGQGVNGFCEANGICRTSFFKWRRQLKKAAGASGFKQLKIDAPYGVSGISGQESLRGLRIWAPNGYQVEANGCGTDALRLTLEVVGKL